MSSIDFIRGVVERAHQHPSPVVFLVGGRSVTIQQNPRTNNLDLTDSDGKCRIRFLIGFPGQEGFTYCARRILETFPIEHRTYPKVTVYGDDSDREYDNESDND